VITWQIFIFGVHILNHAGCDVKYSVDRRVAKGSTRWIMLYQYAILIAVGALTGLLGGMLGIGGSIIMLPAMVWVLGARNDMGVEQIHQYMAAAMIVNFLLSIPSVLAHWKKKAIWPGVVKPLAAGGLIGVIIGVEISLQFTGNAAVYLRWFLGVFFLYVAFDNFRQAFGGGLAGDGESRQAVEAQPMVKKLGIGAAVGVLSGMTGLGGGALAVPSQQYILKSPIRNAIANSSALIAAIAWLGAIAKNAQLGDNGTFARSMVLVACLAPTAMIGSYIGGHLTHSLPTKTVRIIFATLILVSTWKMFKPG
jgi:uncharacterized membrane protein YfcA